MNAQAKPPIFTWFLSLTLQEAFDHAVNGLRQQGCQSRNEFDQCLYRNDSDHRCGAGMLIANDEYDPTIENITALGVMDLAFMPMDAVPTHQQHLHVARVTDERYRELLIQLQYIHDADPDKWEERFQKLARELRLTYKEP